ncbi:MAG TPA: hypothetical protein VLX59_10120, partial [Acidimicrobiales bacterium]|nr:hypothetical protein [Acidimicrobiales bacterium]
MPGVGAAEDPGQGRVQGLVLGLLVSEYLVDEEGVHASDRVIAASGGSNPSPSAACRSSSRSARIAM